MNLTKLERKAFESVKKYRNEHRNIKNAHPDFDSDSDSPFHRNISSGDVQNFNTDEQFNNLLKKNHPDVHKQGHNPKNYEIYTKKSKVKNQKSGKKKKNKKSGRKNKNKRQNNVQVSEEKPLYNTLFNPDEIEEKFVEFKLKPMNFRRPSRRQRPFPYPRYTQGIQPFNVEVMELRRYTQPPLAYPGFKKQNQENFYSLRAWKPNPEAEEFVPAFLKNKQKTRGSKNRRNRRKNNKRKKQAQKKHSVQLQKNAVISAISKQIEKHNAYFNQ